MLQSFSKLRTTSILSIHQIIPFTQSKSLSYKTRIKRLYNDGIDLKQQSVEIDPTERIRRCPFYKDVDLYSFYKTTCPNAQTLGDSLNEGYIITKDGPCVGTYKSSNGTNSIEWFSYSKVIQQSQLIGSYLWTKTKLTPMQSKVAILSSNRPEYLFVEQACYQYGFIVISLYTTYNSSTILSVLQRTQPEILVVDNLERIQSFQNELLNNNQIKEILVLDDIKYDEKSKIRPISSIFKSMKNSDILPRPTVDPESIATFILTSGTTGRIKKNINVNLFILLF
jgi:long-chain acyl-CoA synthetase